MFTVVFICDDLRFLSIGWRMRREMTAAWIGLSIGILIFVLVLRAMCRVGDAVWGLMDGGKEEGNPARRGVPA